jgi:hypothetical protein
MIPYHQRALGIGTIEELLRHWAIDWHSHHRAVREFFADKPGRLLVFDIENDDPQMIARFIAADYAIDPSHYARRHATRAERRLFKRLPDYLLTRSF